MTGTRDGEELNRNSQIVKILTANNGSLDHSLVVGIGIIPIGDDEQPSRQKVGRLGREYLVRAKEDVGHGNLFIM